MILMNFITLRLVLEGHLCSMTKPKDDSKHSLKDPVAAYLASTTTAVIGSSDHVRSIALNDLAVNSKLQVVLPHLVSFFSLQIKHHADKDSFVVLAGYVLLALKALIDNPSILLTPYVFNQLFSPHTVCFQSIACNLQSRAGRGIHRVIFLFAKNF